MTRENTVGIIGAYGMTGSVVSKEIMRTTDLNLVVGGRDEGRAASLATELGVRATARKVDIYDENSLMSFCESCSLIVNCTAPSARVLDIVMKGALRAGSHYVDPGPAMVENLLPYGTDFEQASLIGLIYTGWLPGVTGLALHHVYSLARDSFDGIQSVNVYFEDRSAWSEAAFLDMAEEMAHGSPTGMFENGVWKDQNMIRVTRTYEFPPPVGKRRVLAAYSHELEELAKEARIPEMGMYIGLISLGVLLNVAVIKTLKMDPEKAAGRLRKAWVKAGKKLGEDGIVVAEAAGKKGSRETRVRLSLYSKSPYFMTGLPTAISVRVILEDKVRARGLNLMCDAVDPAYFLREFEKAGVTYELVEL